MSRRDRLILALLSSVLLTASGRVFADERKAADALFGLSARPSDSRPPAADPATGVREVVDPEDNVDRFLLLSPGGPIIVEVTLTFDGRPVRQPRERLVDEVIRSADTNGDGTATWKEALANRRFAFGWLQQRLGKQKLREAYVRQHDRNRNGLLERFEARWVLAGLGDHFCIAGPAFTVRAENLTYRPPDVAGLLDVDKNGTLSVEEWAGIEKLLLRRDADDNQLLQFAELGGVQNAPPDYRFAFPLFDTKESFTAAHLLGPAIDERMVSFALKERYANSEGVVDNSGFGRFRGMFRRLDENGDGALQPGEVGRFDRVKPHVRLRVNMGEEQQSDQGLAVDFLAGSFQSDPPAGGDDFHDAVEIRGPGVLLYLRAPSVLKHDYTTERAQKGIVEVYAGSGRRHISRSDIGRHPNIRTFLEREFGRWDENGDGKVTAAEVAADYRRHQEIWRSMILTTAQLEAPSLFAAMDRNHDRRLSTRELRFAGERLKMFDSNGNGRINVKEVPAYFRIAFTSGWEYQYAQVVHGLNVPPGLTGPAWFERMDTNRDGDVTPNQFLGPAPLFERIDANRDGFIDRAEADDR